MLVGGLGTNPLLRGLGGGASAAPVATAAGGDLAAGAFAELVFDNTEEMLELVGKGDEIAALMIALIEADEWR